MNIRYLKIFCLLSSISLVSFLLPAKMTHSQQNNNLLDKISDYIKKGDQESLSNYFSNVIEMNILKNEGTYSKTQSKFILGDFFKNHPPEDFKIKHKGTSDNGSLYAIGTYYSEGKEYRTYYLIKKEKNDYFLQIIHFGLKE